ncbi:MAG TPA: hypothetical protein VK507_10965 [Iamia sp.]|nr:hypothetical protein [Iamia sp.]
MSETDPLDATRRMWSIGSYADMGDVFAAAGRELVATVGVEGLTVLDVTSSDPTRHPEGVGCADPF